MGVYGRLKKNYHLSNTLDFVFDETLSQQTLLINCFTRDFIFVYKDLSGYLTLKLRCLQLFLNQMR